MICSGSQDGEEPANLIIRPAVERLVGFAEQSQARFVKKAEFWLIRFRLDTIELSAEAAVQDAWLVLLERLRGGGIHEIDTFAEFEKIFALLLRHVISDERRRQNARKRAAGIGALDSAVDAVVPHAVRPDEHVIGEQQAEWLLALLDLSNPSLREIAILRAHGFSNSEIASKRAVSISTIERMLREIRSILGPYTDGRNGF